MRFIYDSSTDVNYDLEDIFNEEYIVLRRILWNMLHKDYPDELIKRNINFLTAIEFSDPIPEDLYDLCERYINKCVDYVGVNDINCWK